MSEKSFGSKIIHSGEVEFMKKVANSVSTSKVPPIYMSSVFSFDDVPSLDAVYGGEAEGYVYSRMTNPSTDCVSDVLAAAEGCESATVFSSGMAAIITAIIANVASGDHIISSPVLYGGVYDYLQNEITRFGVEVTFVDFLTQNIEDFIKPNTKVIYTETISNPLMEVMDLPTISEIAHKHNCKLIVDNTFATPAIVKPLSLGADLVVYSATKFLGGHSDIIGGAALGSTEELAKVRRAATLYGATMSPFDAWLLTRSLRTLHLRMAKHSENALKVAEFLEKHPKIEKVFYPGLTSSPYHALGQKLFESGKCGGMLSANIKGGEEAASKFIAECETIKFVPSLAGVSTTISYPAKTSHRAYSSAEMDAVGITTGQLRFSIGLEEAEDIIAEFAQALDKI